MILLSESYRNSQIELHKNPFYGQASLTFAPLVADIVKAKKIATISDYGAGKQNLLVGLRREGILDIDYFPYDPAFPELGAPKPAQLVCCIDVLEHIEPEYLDNVLSSLAGILENLGFFSIHMGPAQKLLKDGRNAHLIQKPTSWWLQRLTLYFEVAHLQMHEYHGRGFWVVVTKLNTAE
jgi:hypothetical protein